MRTPRGDNDEHALPGGPPFTHAGLPLRTVSKLTGLTPDLIRAWEKRYAVVRPVRGPRGARLYTATDIAHLRLLARVVGTGRAIGDVAGLAAAELEKLATFVTPDATPRGNSAAASPRDEFVTQVLERLARYEHAGVTQMLGDAVVGLGLRTFVYEIVQPLVQRIGSRWADGALSIAEEHLLVGVLRNLLGGLIHARTAAGRPLVLATPAGERHEVGLLMIALLAKDAGVNVVYLGGDLPAAEIVKAVHRTHARVLGLSLVDGGNREHSIAELESIQSGLASDCELWLGGADAREVAGIATAFRGLVVDSPRTMESELARLAAQPSSVSPWKGIG